jgi:hypothetical protein
MSLALLWVKGMCPDRDPSPPAGHSPDQFGTLDRQHQSDAMRRMKTLLYG